MIDKASIRLEKHTFNKIFIVENRNLWPLCKEQCNKGTDLILCVDFALKHQLEEEGYATQFIDHLVDEAILQEENFRMHDFLNEWFKDESGKDLLSYKGYNLGDSLLLHIINDATYFCHYFFNLMALPAIDHQALLVAVEDTVILDCLDNLNLKYTTVTGNTADTKPVFLFPINKWVKEKTESVSLSYRIKNTIASFFDFTLSLRDKLTSKHKKTVYIQSYHPTAGIINALKTDRNLQLILPNYTSIKNILQERRVHYSLKKKNTALAEKLFEHYSRNRSRNWTFQGAPVSDYVYQRIDAAIKYHLGDVINKADSIDKYFRNRKLHLMIPVTNLWAENRLLMNYCRNNGIPVFFVINGLLNTSFLHEGRDSDYLNCYSVSIKEENFNNAPNAFPLGDPRMDKYQSAQKEINYEDPTIIIGAAGYDSLDLNSYLAYEFDFLYDILHCIEQLKKENYKAKVILKVRANGYVHLYSDLVNEYFPDLQVEIIQNLGFPEVIKRADLYISIFSQTIFEASFLGIPAIYYKKDTQTIHAPFDGKSELVTAWNRDELMEKLKLFYNKSHVFALLQKLEVLERYMGPLRGDNTDRNVRFVYDLLNDKIKSYTNN